MKYSAQLDPAAKGEFHWNGNGRDKKKKLKSWSGPERVWRQKEAWATPVQRMHAVCRKARFWRRRYVLEQAPSFSLGSCRNERDCHLWKKMKNRGLAGQVKAACIELCDWVCVRACAPWFPWQQTFSHASTCSEFEERKLPPVSAFTLCFPPGYHLPLPHCQEISSLKSSSVESALSHAVTQLPLLIYEELL